MRFAALFTDRPDMNDVRAQFTAEHQAYLRRYKGQIVLAGALRAEAGGTPLGGLWVFEADSRDAVEAIIAEDPFQREGLRATTTLHVWGTAPGFEDMLIGPKD